MKSFVRLLTHQREQLQVNIIKFPGGEMHARLAENTIQYLKNDLKNNKVVVYANIRDSDGIIATLLLRDALTPYTSNVQVFLPYSPFGRQERRVVAGDSFSSSVFSGLIEVDLAADIHNNCWGEKELHQKDIVKSLCQYEEGMTRVAPDTGAMKKYDGLTPSVYGKKVRDPITGNILGMELVGDPRGKDCFVVDDICDGGRTFTELGKLLKAGGAGRLTLYVTHGIFSKGFDELFKYYHTIITTDSWYTPLYVPQPFATDGRRFIYKSIEGLMFNE